MSGRKLSAGLYHYQDFEIEDWFETETMFVSEDVIDRFAELTGDRFAIHMHDEAARAVGFERRVAHGLLILSLIDGLKNQTAIQIKAVASLGWDWNFTRPVLAGDWINAIFTAKSKRLTRDSARGIVTFAVDVRNQNNEVVQHGTNNLMILTKNPSPQ